MGASKVMAGLHYPGSQLMCDINSKEHATVTGMKLAADMIAI